MTEVGFTNNLKSRLLRHTSGKVTATKFRRPLQLIHDAKAREIFLKSGYGKDQLKQFLKNTSSSLK